MLNWGRGHTWGPWVWLWGRGLSELGEGDTPGGPWVWILGAWLC